MIWLKKTLIVILVGGLIAGAVTYIEVRLNRRHIIRLAEKGEMAYYPIYSLIFLIATIGFLWLAYYINIQDPRPASLLLRAVSILFFLLPLIAFLHCTFARIRYSGQGISVFSPWKSTREIPWYSITEYRWNNFLQNHILETDRYGKIVMGEDYPGLPWFWGALAEKRPDIFEMLKEQKPDLFEEGESD